MAHTNASVVRREFKLLEYNLVAILLQLARAIRLLHQQ
jgi:hypothetical protein